ncbi:hypothetical protein L3X38_026971 [Prunus dulcis]|uniref:RNase H type-1 domain-containing protein n=1 Tax=Prunus dulcis TaxID=3755 RepID=A0AAD4VM18_PRUDU|nr:hypothetical protein L3X38_026971 [Prunus dulcis]
MPTEPYETDLHTRVPISTELIVDARTQERGNIHARTQEPIVHSRTKDLIIDDDLILDDDLLLSSLASTREKMVKAQVSTKKVKSKSTRTMLLHEDDEIDKDPLTFDSGNHLHSSKEYQALIMGLQMAVEMKISSLEVYGDSMLVIN